MPNKGAAANRRPVGQSDGSGNLFATVAADRAFPAAVAELGRYAAGVARPNVPISNPYILGLLGAAVIIAIIHLAEKYLIRKPFWRKSVMYPADHALASGRVLKFVDVIAANHALTDDEIVAALVQQEIPKLDSELLVRFVPMAFTWMVLRKMGVVSFPSSFIVFDKRDRPVEMPIAREHYFASALVIADNVLNHGFSDQITRPTFEAIITRSAEMDSANKVLAAGKELAGSKILSPVILGLSAEEIAARPAA